MKAAPIGKPLMVDAHKVILENPFAWMLEVRMDWELIVLVCTEDVWMAREDKKFAWTLEAATVMVLTVLAWRDDVRAIRELMVGAWIVEAARTPAVKEEMVAVEAFKDFTIEEFVVNVWVERVLTVKAVGWVVPVVYHLPALPVRERDPKAVVMVLLVVPSSKVSEPLVVTVMVEAAAAPVVSFKVSVRPGIVVVRGNVIVPGRVAELRKTRLVAVDNDMSLYCCLGSFW